MAARNSLSRDAIECCHTRILAHEPRRRGMPPGTRPDTGCPRAPAGSAARRDHRARFRRIVVFAAIVLLVDLLASSALAMMQPANLPFGVRAAEWFRHNGRSRTGAVGPRGHHYSLNATRDRRGTSQDDAEGWCRAESKFASYALSPIAPVITPGSARGTLARHRSAGPRGRARSGCNFWAGPGLPPVGRRRCMDRPRTDAARAVHRLVRTR
jgi:hypothetical protein